jgi:hypothetical protein
MQVYLRFDNRVIIHKGKAKFDERDNTIINGLGKTILPPPITTSFIFVP